MISVARSRSTRRALVVLIYYLQEKHEKHKEQEKRIKEKERETKR